MDRKSFEIEVKRIVRERFAYLTGDELTKPSQCNATLSTLQEPLSALARAAGCPLAHSYPNIKSNWESPHMGEPAEYEVVITYSIPGKTATINVPILPRVVS